MDIRMIGALCVLTFLLAACAGTGQTPDDPAAAGADGGSAVAAADGKSKTEADADEDLVCREVVRTGTRFSETICAPRDAWQRSEEHGQKATEDIQRRPTYQDEG
jgi:hypothetical protein